MMSKKSRQIRLKFSGILGTWIDKYLHKFLVHICSLDSLYSQIPKNQLINSENRSTPEVLRMNFLPSASSLKRETYLLPDIYSITLNNILYSPTYNIIFTRSRQIIAESINTKKTVERFSVSNLYRKKTETISGVCSILRSTDNSYYHTIIENISRLYLLDRDEYRNIKEIKLLLSSPPNQIEKFYLDKVLPKNVKITVVDRNKNYLLKQLIFPTFLTRRFSGYLPSEYLIYFRKKILPKRERNQINRIFISRSQNIKKLQEITQGLGRHELNSLGVGRYILNEDELFDRLKSKGFKRYILEQISLEEQIELFYDAEYIVGAHGAGLSNTIFSTQAKILELFPSQFVVPHYFYLSKSLGHTYTYWCGSEKGVHDNFIVDVSEIIICLKNLGIY